MSSRVDALLEQTISRLSQRLLESHPRTAQRLDMMVATSHKCRYLQKCASGGSKTERQELWRQLGAQDKEELLQMRSLKDGGLGLVVEFITHETRQTDNISKGKRRRRARLIEQPEEGKPRKIQKIRLPEDVPRHVVTREPMTREVVAATVGPPAFDPESEGSPLLWLSLIHI